MLRRNMHVGVSTTPHTGDSAPQFLGDSISRATAHQRRLRFAMPFGARRHDQSGAAVVEFALILIPFLTLIFGMIQYGLYFYSAQTGSHTVGTALRELSVGNCQDAAALKAYVENELGTAAKDGTVTVTSTYKNIDGSTPAAPQAKNVTVGGQVKLTISFDSINMNFPILPFLDDAHVSRTARARVEDKSDEGCSL